MTNLERLTSNIQQEEIYCIKKVVSDLSKGTLERQSFKYSNIEDVKDYLLADENNVIWVLYNDESDESFTMHKLMIG